ncbi:MAG: 2-amino-4-hydroxy-6-hydroxymethyldihydropteridine diphosphokinase [Pseudomonadota bacterium]
MSLIIALGSNLGNRLANLQQAATYLSSSYSSIASSRVYRSEAVDEHDQPFFFNQVLEFKIPSCNPEMVMSHLLSIENTMGRVRERPKGPRIIDIDIVFWGLEKIQGPTLKIPHPRWGQRSFVVRPLRELPYFLTLINYFDFPENFEVEAFLL